MEGGGTDSLPAADPLPASELERNGYDDEELLLRMLEANNETVSPSLQAVLDVGGDSEWPSGQRQQSPLLMERPQSSGIDMAAFSFAKPVNNVKPFSLQLSTRRCSSVAVPQAKSGQDGLEITNSSNREHKSQAKSVRTRSAESGSSLQRVESSTNLIEKTNNSDAQISQSMGRGEKARVGAGLRAPDPRVGPLAPLPAAESSRQRSFPEYGAQGSKSLALIQRSDNQCPEPPKNSNARFEEESSDGHALLRENPLPEQRSASDQWRVVKRRRPVKRKPRNTVRRTPSDNESSQLPEEVLFQQLISRIRAREENEALASHLKEEMEASVSSLKEENRVLKEELELLDSKLHEKTTEARAYRSQTESWKSRLAKIKTFLNELGADYQNLRGEAIHLKAGKKSLERERKEIADSLEDAKARLTQISQTSKNRRGCISESENLIVSLRQDLAHAREKAQYSQDQLADEKKRSRLLESYIQNCSRSHDRKLDLIKADQLELVKRLESALETACKNCESSHTVTNDALHCRVDELVALLRNTAEDLSSDKMDVQQYRETIRMFESRMDTTTRRLEEDIERNSEVNGAVMKNLKEQLQVFRDTVSDGSPLLKQLSASENRCSSLEEKLQTTTPALETLRLSIEGLQKSEASLEQKMEDLRTNISEAKIPERFGEIYVHVSEKLGLQKQVDQLSFRLKLTEEKLEIQQLNNVQQHNELLEMTARAHQAESEAARFESDIVALHERVKAAEKKAQDDLDRAVVSSRNQCRLEFEQQLQETLGAKLAIEQDTQKLKERLVETECKLAERENSAARQRSDLEAVLSERQKRIEEFEIYQAEQTSNVAKQEAEINGLRQQATMLITQQTSLQNQLDEANKRTDSTQGELLKAMAEHHRRLQTSQDDIASLKIKLSNKEEEVQALRRDLEDANNARSNLESGKSKAKAEIHALLRRVQGSESWIKRVKEMLHRLNIAQLEQPFSESLDQLELMLQENAKHTANARADRAQIRTPETSARHDSSRAAHGGRDTEDRTQGVTLACETATPVNKPKGRSPSNLAGAIVPFSSILQGLSPSHGLSTEHEQFNLLSVLTQSPETKSPTEEPSAPVKPREDNVFPEKSPQSKRQQVDAPSGNERKAAPSVHAIDAQRTQEPTRLPSLATEQDPFLSKEPIGGRKVSFVTRNSTAERDDCQVPDSQAESQDVEATFLDTSLVGDNPAHTSRWTYSKRRRETSAKQQHTSPPERVSSQREEHQMHSENGRTKRTKFSTVASSLVSQARAPAEHHDRKKSPTKLASGSSRTPSSNMPVPSQTGSTRSTRRVGRRTRGDRYNARFSQGA